MQTHNFNYALFTVHTFLRTFCTVIGVFLYKPAPDRSPTGLLLLSLLLQIVFSTNLPCMNPVDGVISSNVDK